MTGYCRDAYRNQLPHQDEASWEAVEREGDPSADWQIPLRWMTASMGALSAISLGLGLVLKWLLQ